MKRWLAFLCLTVLLIAQCAAGPTLSVASDDLLLGDVDGDGNISMKDALFMRKYIAHQGELAIPDAADLNGDQSVDMRDVLLLRKYIAHLIKAFPAGPAEPPLKDLSSSVAFFRYGYNQLSDIEKAAYKDVVNAIEANLYEETTAYDGVLGLTARFTTPLPDENSAACVFRAVYADHPEFYFLCTHYSFTRWPGGPVKTLLLHYNMNAAERKQAGSELLQVVNDWVSALPFDASAADKEIALHDRLCEFVTYTSGEEPFPDIYYSPYSALVNGSAVCDGYARALQLLCLAAEIPATVVEGFSAEGKTHMWNVVYLEGEPYYVDPTWNDSQAFTSHAYCNITTAEITPSHTMNFWFPIPPSCTATKYNYYLHCGRYVTTADGEDFGRIVVTARQRGESSAEVRFAPNVFNNNWQITESGFLCTIYNSIKPEDAEPLPGYVYYLFDSMDVIAIVF